MVVKCVISENIISQKVKWCSKAKSTGDVSLIQLSKEITQRSTANSGRTLAVLDVLTQVLTEHLNR